MRYATILRVEREDDWHFFDIEIGLYSSKEEMTCGCSACGIGGREPDEIIKLCLPYKFVKEICGRHPQRGCNDR